ncbi:hypothetical protein ACFY1J_31040 [Streptomyces sp. NPDC001406]|uniref:hypothetical protein n=1 Tax=Streptomyces sp. NPDC001406 TaxID=3364572 RepID=UPI003676F109
MGRRMTAVAWLERHYDALFACGEEIVSPVMSLMGLPITSYAADPTADGPGPLFTLKRDALGPEPQWPDAAFWPEPHSSDDLDAW